MLARDLIGGGGLGAGVRGRDTALPPSPQPLPPQPSTWAAFIAGAAVTFGAYRMAHVVQLNMLQTGWMLFALLFLRRLLLPAGRGGGRWRDALLCGLFCGLQAANAFYYGFFTAILVIGYVGLWAIAALWARWRRGVALPWATIPRLLLAGALAAAIAVPFLLPYLSIYQTLGIVRSPRELDNWSAPLRAYVAVLDSSLLYGRLGEAVVDSGEMVLFPGLLIAALGLGAAAWLAWRRLSPSSSPPAPLSPGERGDSDSRVASRESHIDWLFWALTGLASFVLSLGTGVRLVRFGEVLPIPLPYLTLYRLLPGFGSMRVPARWGWLVTLALALFAALALAGLLRRARGAWRHALGAGLLLVVLAEQAAFPLPITPPLLRDPPPVYAWLGAPAQADIQTVIELPTGPLPRGDNLARITLRHFYSLLHWKRLPVAYGAIIPFGAVDLMRRLDSLPDPSALALLQMVGVDTLVVHADEYAPADLSRLTAAFAESPLLRLRATVGASRVYTLQPFAGRDLPPGSVLISNDERMPGEAALGLIRHWQDAGHSLYGPGRLRYYAPLRPLAPGQIADYGLLSDAEDPADYGYSADSLLWRAIGLALYRRPAGALASLSLGEPVPGQFHPRFPAGLDLELRDGRLLVDGRALDLGGAAGPLTLEIDCARLRPGALQVAGAPLDVPAGLSTIRLPIRPGAPLALVSPDDATALLRLRVRAAAAASATADPGPGVVAAVETAFRGDVLTLRAGAAGAPGLLVDVWGAAASDDHPVHLISGVAPLAADGSLQLTLGLLAPEGAWIDQRGRPEDGRYIVYVKDPHRPEGPGRPVAKFLIRDGRVAQPEPVPLPLTIVP